VKKIYKWRKCFLKACDLRGVKAYAGADIEDLYTVTLGIVVVDYRSYRVAAQPIIPGQLLLAMIFIKDC